MNEKEISCAFTGHRIIPYDKRQTVWTKLKYAILESYHAGYRIFYCGMARGFDLMAAEALLRIRETYPEIQLIAAVPYRSQPSRFNEYDRKRYSAILAKADRVEMLSEEYYDGCLLRRNDYMLAHSKALIAYYDGMPSGGTCYTVNRARRTNLLITNIY